MAKDLKAGMGKGLGSLVQPKTDSKPAAAEEPQQAATEQKKKAGRTSKAAEPAKPSSVTMGLRSGYTRATLICNICTLAKIREIAYLERTPAMDVVEEALADYVAKYESKHGVVVPPAPKKRR